MPRVDPIAKIRDRKEDYIEKTTDLDWLNLNMLRWEFSLPDIDLSISFNLEFNFLLDFYLSLDLHFPFEEFDFQMPDFRFDWPKINKAYYGQTKYGESVYDPPEILYQDLARFLWDMRYKTTEDSSPDYKNVGETLRKYIELNKEILEKKGVSKHYIDMMIEKLMKVEGKVLNSAYVGFSIVNLSKVMQSVIRRGLKSGIGLMRTTDDFKSEKQFYTAYPYETTVNYSRVNYCRVIPNAESYKQTHLKPLSKELEKRINEFKIRSSKTPITQYFNVEIRPEISEYTAQMPTPTHTIYQRTFFLQKRHELEWEGGKHQARLQHIIERVRPILDRYGVVSNLRAGYVAFAKEYVYMHYKSSRKYKQWKRLLTEDDLIEKYKKMGYDEKILRDIINAVKILKGVSDIESTMVT